METMKVIKINSRGQIVLPAEFRKLLGIDENTQMLVRMLDDGGLEIRPASIVPISNYLESHPEVRKKVLASYRQAKKGKVLGADETKRLLETDGS
ncbi:MAG: AbrB/MazE/SpoVT family DNA-binding domain-containing protein [Desulfatitalea sp.]